VTQPRAHAPEPPRTLTETGPLLLGYLDYYRSVIASKVVGLSEAQLRTAPLPSGWTPLGLLNHLVHMERRWLRWGFMAEHVEDVEGDQGVGPWLVPEDATLDGLLGELEAVGSRTRAIVSKSDLTAPASTGGRFAADDPRPAPTLGWILFHVLQEYARHAGHLDAARELIDGQVGE